jgi:hypothetical protein
MLLAGSAVSLPRLGTAQGEQLSDPTFDPRVARPAYQRGAGPRVGFDEAHFNFHTAGGRYKAFADLLTHDGYRLSPNRDRLSPRVLRSYDLLVIANALGAPDPGAAAASSTAFTEAEARALASWLRDGGALLLISDHHPTGAAAQRLATQLGVRMSDAAVVDTTAGNHLEGYFQTNLERSRAWTGGLRAPAAVTREDAARRRLHGPGLPLRSGARRRHWRGRDAQRATRDRGRRERQDDASMGDELAGVDNRQLALNIARWLTQALR